MTKVQGATRKKGAMASMMSALLMGSMFGGDKGKGAARMSAAGFFGAHGNPIFLTKNSFRGKKHKTNRHKFSFRAKLKRRGVR